MMHTPKMANCLEINVVSEHFFEDDTPKNWGFYHQTMEEHGTWQQLPNTSKFEAKHEVWITKNWIAVGIGDRDLSKIGECTVQCQDSTIIKHIDLTTENGDFIIKWSNGWDFIVKSRVHRNKTWRLNHQTWSRPRCTPSEWFESGMMNCMTFGRHLQRSTAIPSNGARQPWNGGAGRLMSSPAYPQSNMAILNIHRLLMVSNFPSGNLLHRYWTWPTQIASCTTKNGDFPVCYVNVDQRLQNNLH